MKIIYILLLAGLVSSQGCTTDHSSKQMSENSTQQGSLVIASKDRLEPHNVCMVNDAYMGKEQIRIDFEGKTYYGCCQMCVKRIRQDRTARFSTDPVTGKEVDKAKAIITLKPGSADEVLYFESQESYSRYKSM